MTGRDRQRAPAGSAPSAPQQATPTTRNNEYFLPRDGIDREVITADICRYLGNDALVRPGHLEKGDRIIQGYYITAYRNLTSAMIESLKEDSQKWVEEKRRAQGAQGGQMRYMDSSVRNPAGVFQHIPGPNRDFSSPPAPYSDPYGAQGQGAVGQYPPQDARYAAQGAFPPREPVYDDRQDPYGPPRGNPQQYVAAGYGQAPDAPYHATGMNMPYAGQAAPQQYMTDHAGRPAASPYPPNSAAGAYPPQPAGYYNMPHSAAPPPPAAVAYDAPPPVAQARDVFHGRGAYPAATSPTSTTSDFVASPAGTTGYPNPGIEQQYDPDPSRSRASATPTTSSANAQMANSGNPPAPPRREHTRDHTRDRERDRYSTNTRR